MAELDAFSRKIADILSATAEERGISQSKLAAKSGVSQAQISRIFGYKRSVSLEDLFLIAEALDRPAREIVAIVEADLNQQKERKVEEAASALDTEDAPDAAGVLRRLSIVDGGHAASVRRGHAPSLTEIEQTNGHMA